MRIVKKSFVDKIIDLTDIQEVLGQFLQIKKIGPRAFSCCPFHDDTNPSLSISRIQKTYYCFGCQAKGNVINFLMSYRNSSFVESIEYLANWLSIPIEYDASYKEKTSYINLYKTLAHVSDYFYSQKPEKAIHYLKQRLKNENIILEYKIGYSASLVHPKTTDLPKFDLNLLIQGGLVRQTPTKQIFDVFQSRIIFPIRDIQGNYIGFGGRVLDNHTLPKYLNSPASDIFDKQKAIYGLYELLKRDRTPKEIVLVEGYMDVVTLVDHGYPNAVACLGTSINKTQVDTLFRYTNKVIICLDGDTAGKLGAQKMFDTFCNALFFEKSFSVCIVPDNEDPASFIVKNGLEEFTKLISLSLHYEDFFIKTVRKDHTFQTLENANLYLSKMQNHNMKLALTYKFQQTFGQLPYIPERDSKLSKKDFNVDAFLTSRTIKADSIIQKTITFMIQFPGESSRALKNIRYQITDYMLHNGLDERIETLFTILLDDQIVFNNTANLLEYIRTSSHELYDNLFHMSHHDFLLEESMLIQEFNDMIQRILCVKELYLSMRHLDQGLLVIRNENLMIPLWNNEKTNLLKVLFGKHNNRPLEQEKNING